jgi:phytoene dehydrogenase-like protein
MPLLRGGARRRVLVVGAGHNGLVCAIALAAADMEVSVLEQGATAGGGLCSAELTLPGHLHDLHAAFFPQAAVSPPIRRLELERHGVEWIAPPVAMAHPFQDGSVIALHRELSDTAASLERAARGAGTAWTELVERLWPCREAVIRAALSPFPPALPATRLALALRRDALQLARRLVGSAASLGGELFADERASAWLAGSVGHSDLTPGEAGSAAIAFGLAFLGHLVGWPLPRGGAGSIARALTRLLEARGGELRCDARVETIEVTRGRVTGVRLAGGERLQAQAAVATVGPAPLLRMLPPGALGERVTSSLARWRYGLGTFKLDAALAGAVPWRSAVAREAAVVHVGGELRELFAAADSARRGEMPERPTIVVGQQSLHDATRAPAGAHTLYAYARVPREPVDSDERIAELVERRIEELAPGFRSLVRARALRGPRAQEQANPALVAGDLAAGSLQLDQQLLFRPTPELCRGRTPLRGLYVAGGSVHPGPGVHGVSGEQAARALLRDLGPVGAARRAVGSMLADRGRGA